MSTSSPRWQAKAGEVVKFRLGDQQVELPTVVGSEGEHALDISKLRAQSGYITLDEGYVNTGSTTSAITFLDGEKGVLRYRGYPVEVIAEKCDFIETSYLLIYGELPNAGQLEAFRAVAAAAHDAARGHAVVLQRLSPRRASDGDPRLGRRAPVDVLSRLAQSARSEAGRDFGPPADGQAADDRGLCLQEIDRPAVHLSAQRFVVLREFLADDVLGAERALPRRSRLRHRAQPAVDRACRPRAELQHVDRADGRLQRRQFVRVDLGGHFGPVGPACTAGPTRPASKCWK